MQLQSSGDCSLSIPACNQFSYWYGFLSLLDILPEPCDIHFPELSLSLYHMNISQIYHTKALHKVNKTPNNFTRISLSYSASLYHINKQFPYSCELLRLLNILPQFSHSHYITRKPFIKWTRPQTTSPRISLSHNASLHYINVQFSYWCEFLSLVNILPPFSHIHFPVRSLSLSCMKAPDNNDTTKNNM